MRKTKPGKLLHGIEYTLKGDPKTIKELAKTVSLTNNSGLIWTVERLEQKFKEAHIKHLGDVTLAQNRRSDKFEAQDFYRLVSGETLIIGQTNGGWNQVALRAGNTNLLSPHFREQQFIKRWIDSRNPEKQIAECYKLVVYRGKKGQALQRIYPAI